MRKTFVMLVAAAALAVPRAALACSVCFGQSDSPMAKATNMGIILMLVVVAGMLASFAAFFIYLNRRARLVAHEAETRLGPADAGRYLPDPQEGTAQC